MLTFSPAERNIKLLESLDNWNQILEENDEIVRSLQQNMVVTEMEYQEFLNNR